MDLDQRDYRYFDIDVNMSDYPDTKSGLGMTISVFFPGCTHNCKDCHNPNLQDPEYDKCKYTYTSIDELYSTITYQADRNCSKNIALMGGDPFYYGNANTTHEISTKLVDNGYNVIIYTGYEITPCIKNRIEKGMKFTLLKTGKYIPELAQQSRLTDELFVLGSTNQKIYNMDLELLSIDGIYKYN